MSKANTEPQATYQTCNEWDLYNVCSLRTCIVIDLRSQHEFEAAHINDSWHFEMIATLSSVAELQSTLGTQLKSFQLRLQSTLKKKQLSPKALKLFVIGSKAHCSDSNAMNAYKVIANLLNSLRFANSQLFCSRVSFVDFQKQFPFLCSNFESNESNELKEEKETNDLNLKTINVNDSKYPNALLNGRLFLGNAKHAMDASIFEHLGITHCVNATTSVDNLFAKAGSIGKNKSKHEGIKYVKISLEDSESVDLTPYFNPCCVFIKSALNSNHGHCLVHCEQGISRSPTIVIAFLMKCHNLSFFDAYSQVLSVRSIIHPNSGFMDQLSKYEISLFDGKSTYKQANQLRMDNLQKMMM